MFDIKKRGSFLVILFLLAVGLPILWWIADSKDNSMRSQLLQQAKLAAKGIPYEFLKKLSGSEKDLKSPAYWKIKGQLAQMRNVKPDCRFLYIMGRRADRKIFFFVDSLPPNAKDYAPPGLIYNEVPDSYIPSFDTNREAVVGPVTDRWGTLITALIPIVSEDNHSLLAVMGMDIEAGNWYRKIIHYCIGPSLVIVLLIILFSIMVSREKILARLHNSEERFRTLSDAAFEGIIISDRGKILDANSSIVNMTGYSVEELLQMTTIDLFRPEDQEKAKRNVFSGYEKPYEITGLTKDGVEVPMEVSGKMHSFNGKEVRITAFRDLTEKKKAEEEIRTLQGILPICSYCKQIRNDKGYWSRIESYISEHSAAEFSHSICPECMNKYFPDIKTGDE